MPSPLDGIAKAAHAALGGVFYEATLTRDVPAASSESFDPATPTEQSYTCRGLVEAYSKRWRAEGLVEQNDRKVLILSESLSVTPRQGDRVAIRGITFTVVRVDTDPAQAVWEIQGRM